RVREAGELRLHDEAVDAERLPEHRDVGETPGGSPEREPLLHQVLEHVLALGRDGTALLVDEVSPAEVVPVAGHHRLAADAPRRRVVRCHEELAVVRERPLGARDARLGERALPAPAVLADDRERRDRVGEPPVPHLRRQLDGLALLRRDPDRGRALDRLRAERDALGVEVPSPVRDRGLRPEPPNEGRALAEERRAVAQLAPEGGELLGPVPLPHAEDHPPARDDVEHGAVFRDVDRVVEREEQDAGPELDARRLRRNEAERDERRGEEPVLDEMVLADEDGIESDLLPRPDLLDRLPEHLIGAVARTAFDAVHEPEPHLIYSFNADASASQGSSAQRTRTRYRRTPLSASRSPRDTASSPRIMRPNASRRLPISDAVLPTTASVMSDADAL